MSLHDGIVRQLICGTPPLDPKLPQGSSLAFGLIEFDDSSVYFTKTIMLTLPTLFSMGLHAETHLHAETVYGSTLKLLRFVSILNEKSHAETQTWVAALHAETTAELHADTRVSAWSQLSTLKLPLHAEIIKPSQQPFPTTQP